MVVINKRGALEALLERKRHCLTHDQKRAASDAGISLVPAVSTDMPAPVRKFMLF